VVPPGGACTGTAPARACKLLASRSAGLLAQLRIAAVQARVERVEGLADQVDEVSRQAATQIRSLMRAFRQDALVAATDEASAGGRPWITRRHARSAMNDPIFQTFIVGVALNLAAAGVAFYLWSERRSERFLLFWALAWTAGLLRWLIHYPAESRAGLRMVEGLMIPMTMFFMVLGSYDLLPNRPWRHRMIVGLTAVILLVHGTLGITTGLPIEMGYALFAAVLGFCVACAWVAFRSTGLEGYVFVSATCLYQLGVVAVLLFRSGGQVANSIIVPLYNLPLMLSIVLIAFQRHRRQLRTTAEEVRQLYVRLANVEDDERRALHAALHDRVGANLAALRIELDVASSMMSPTESSGVQRHLAGAREIATETIVMARDLMAELRPSALDDYGLVAALRNFAESQGSRMDLSIDVVGEDLTPRPDMLVEGALFRIAQEAVINAARHASATRVGLRVGARDGRVSLTIEDDGVGFDLRAPGVGPAHWGLKNMRERARAVGGTLVVETAPGSGTRVTAEAPSVANEGR
jgi:signal transduction histidine kinase